jgi:hypothetical protein
MDYHKDTKRVRSGLREAFKILRRRGYSAKANFWCCQSCGLRAIPDEVRKYVFYHAQDNDSLNERGICHLNWGVMAVKSSSPVGLKVDWNGTDAQQIQVSAHPLN